MAKNKYTDIDESNDDKWKKKYLSSLEELENKEQLWNESENNLRALISHLTNAADTSSVKLTKQLEVLRDAINRGVPANKLRKAINEVADSVLSLEAIRSNKKTEPKNTIVNLLEKIKPAGKIESKLTKISGKFSKLDTNKEMSPLIEELAKLFIYGLSITEKNKEKVFLSSLLSKSNDVPSRDIEIENTEKSANSSLNLNNAIQSLILLLEKNDLTCRLTGGS